MHARTILVSLTAVALALAFDAASAKGDIATGKTKAAACAACHGADGNGSTSPPYAPALAGQYQDYLERALHEYKDGERTNAIMNGMAAPLTTQDIQDITAYFSSLPTKLSNLHGKIVGGD